MDRRLHWLGVACGLALLFFLNVYAGVAALRPTMAQVVKSAPVADQAGQAVVRAAARPNATRSRGQRALANNLGKEQPGHAWLRRPAASRNSSPSQDQPSSTVAEQTAPQAPGLPQVPKSQTRQPAPTVRSLGAAAPQRLPDAVHASPLNENLGEELEQLKGPTIAPAPAPTQPLGTADAPQHRKPEPTTGLGAAASEQGKADDVNQGGQPNNHPSSPASPASKQAPQREQEHAQAPALAPELDLPSLGAADEGKIAEPPASDEGSSLRTGTSADPAASEPHAGTNTVADTAAEPPAAYPATTEPLSPELVALRDSVRQVLRTYAEQRLNTRDHTPWEVMHRIVAYGTACEILRGGPQGTPVNAMGWLLYGGRCKGQRIVSVERDRLTALQGVGLQGHPGQLLAIVAQGRARADYPIVVDGRTFTLADLIESEKLSCRSGIELTFKLISLSWYLESDSTWRNAEGEEWSISRLVKEEIEAPILRKAACGGTHRLMGLTYAVREREKEGKPIDGQFLRAQKYLADYQEYTFKLQNADGSFSTEWFVRRGARPDLDRRLQTTGHILEWLVYSIPESMLRDPRVVRAVDYLSGILRAQPNRRWEIGPLGHALHALAIYDQRAFVPHDSAAATPVAEREALESQAATAPHSRRGVRARNPQ